MARLREIIKHAHALGPASRDRFLALRAPTSPPSPAPGRA
jgi:hypothetical protein